MSDQFNFSIDVGKGVPDSKNQQFSLSDGWLNDADSRTAYDAVAPQDGNQNRRPNRRIVYTADTHLRQNNRRRAIATSQDMQRNFAAVSWAIRKHVDYVTDLRWVPQTGDEAFDEQLLEWFDRWGRAENFDVRARHNFREFVRISEARRLVDGDFFAAKIAGNGRNRGKIQPIEGYRIEDPFEQMSSREIQRFNLDRDVWHNGVELDRSGKNRRYAVFHRSIQGNRHFDGFISARKLIQLGYFERFDQVRGISPLLSGLNTFIDTYDGIDMQQAKMRISALFGLVLYRDAVVGEDQIGGPYAQIDGDGDGIPEIDYQFDFGGGPQLMDLAPGDKADFLESKTPTEEVVAFLNMMLNMAIKTLDIPDCFFSEGEANYSSTQAAMKMYLRSCRAKQKTLTEWLDKILEWRIGLADMDGDILRPKGMSFRDIKWKWQPLAHPLVDPLKDAKAAKEMIELGATNIEEICCMTGTTPLENLQKNQKWYKRIEDADYELPWKVEEEEDIPMGDMPG